MDLKKNWPYIVAIVIILAGITFFAIKFLKKPSQTANLANSNSGSFGNYGGNGGGQGQRGSGSRGNFNPIAGTIASIDSSVITMTKSDNTTQKVNYTSSTRIMEQQNGQRTTLAISDLKTGDAITVMGSVNGDTIDARMIFLGQFTPPQRGSYQGGNGSGWQNNGSGGGGNSSSGSSTDPSGNSI